MKKVYYVLKFYYLSYLKTFYFRDYICICTRIRPDVFFLFPKGLCRVGWIIRKLKHISSKGYLWRRPEHKSRFCLFLCLTAHTSKVAVLLYFEPFLNYGGMYKILKIWHQVNIGAHCCNSLRPLLDTPFVCPHEPT